MRIGLLAYGLHGHSTGIGLYVSELARGLKTQHPDVEIILLIPRGSPLPELASEFEHVRVPQIGRLPSIVTIGSSVLDKVARRLRLDVLHDPCGIAPFVWPKSFAYGRAVTIHDVIPRLHPEWYPLPDRLLFRTMVAWSRWTADAVFTVSETSRQDIIKTLRVPAHRVHVTPNGVHLPRPTELAQSRTDPRFVRWKPYFLMAGDMTPRKNTPRLLQAFAKLRAGQPRVNLLLTGPRGLPLPLPDHVYHLGYVSREELASLYVNAVAVVVPSLYEGFGLPVLEAMAHGTATICSSAGSLPEVAGQAACLVDPYDIDGWAKAMARVLSDPLHRGQLVVDGLARARSFSWAETCHRTYNVYSRLA